LDGLEIEIKRWDDDYSFSSEENGKKRIYTIYSPKLRQKLREIIFPCEVPSRVSVQYKGKNSHGDRVVYQPGKSDLPDQLTLISREIVDQQEIDEEREQEKEKNKWDQRKEEWKNREAELGISSNGGTRSYWYGKDKEGNIVNEGTYFKSETESYLISLERVKTDDRKQDFTLHQQIPLKKG